MSGVGVLSPAQVEAYLERIRYRGGREPTRANLCALVRAHRYSVPYDSLDIWRGLRTPLDTGYLFDKIVTRRRGGYCFELNGLFAALLRGLGYRVAESFGRWLLGEDSPLPMRRHRILRVGAAVGETMLADVGVGVPFLYSPLDCRLDVPQIRDGRCYRLVRDPEQTYVVEVMNGGRWTRLCSFDTALQYDVDFEAVHWWCETSPESRFLSGFWVFLPFADGTLRTLSRESDPETGKETPVLALFDGRGGIERRFLRDEKELAAALLENFGIVE